MNLRDAIEGAYALLPSKLRTLPADVLLYATQRQENLLQLQKQVGGPAAGLWQFEQGGGVRGVLTHPASRKMALAVLAKLGLGHTEREVYDELLGTDDVLDAAFARLLYWTDPRPLPEVGDVEAAWQLYLRTWRPGAYTRGSAKQRAALRKKWSESYAWALEEVAA